MNAVVADVPQVAHVTVRSDPPTAHWDAYVRSRRQASGYHLSAWSDLIGRAFGHETRRLSAYSGGEIVGVLPLVIFKSRLFGRFMVSMPFLNGGGVVGETPEAEAALLDAAIGEARNVDASHLELRHTYQHFPQLASKRHKVAMLLKLEQTPEHLWRTLDRKVRNQVRKAEKHGLRAVHGGPERLSSFYSVFARNMRDLGTPVYDVRFFGEVLSTFPDNTRIFCVLLEDQPIAASLIYWHGGTVEVPWASSIRQFNPLCPNTLLYWEMLRHSSQEGFQQFHFGRSTPGEGTYHFKRQWGAQPHELVWEYWTAETGGLPDLSPKNPRFRGAISLWRRLPVGLTRVVGPLIVRNIP